MSRMATTGCVLNRPPFRWASGRSLSTGSAPGRRRFRTTHDELLSDMTKGGIMKPGPAFTHSSLVALLLCTAMATASSLAADGATAVAIQNPRLLPPDPIPCERIALGEPDDYKPCIA